VVGTGRPADEFLCDSYGGGAPLLDPDARIAVANAVALGNDSSAASLIISVASSTTVAGFLATFRFPQGVLRDVVTAPVDLSGFRDPNPDSRFYVSVASATADRLTVAFLTTIPGTSNLPASAERPVLEITLCLAQGVGAGEYPIEIETAELIDFDSARSIPPEMGHGTLVVESDVTAAECPEAPEPPDAPDPSDAEVIFRLADVTTASNAQTTVPFFIRSDAAVGGYSASIDFDETLLSVVAVDSIFSSGSDAFRVVEWNNSDESAGSGGVDEGFIAAVEIFGLSSPVALPTNQDIRVLDLVFDVQDVEDQVTTIAFLDGAIAEGQAVRNVSNVDGAQHTPDTLDAFFLVDGTIQILAALPEVTVFVRGDSNNDMSVNLSDAANFSRWEGSKSRRAPLSSTRWPGEPLSAQHLDAISRRSRSITGVPACRGTSCLSRRERSRPRPTPRLIRDLRRELRTHRRGRLRGASCSP